MAEILSHFRSIDIINYVGVEDFADRLNFLFTPTLLGALCTIVTVRTYFLHPISCWVPNQFGTGGGDGQISFVNNFCWTEGTYAVKPSEFRLDNSLEDGGIGKYKEHKIVYYQWIPFVLGMQAVMFCIPRLFWHMFSYERAGTDVAHIVKIAKDASHESGENREKLVGHACRMLQQMICRNLDNRGTCAQPGSVIHLCCRCASNFIPSRLVGSWLILTYFIVKLAYLGNSLGQLALMQSFLQLNATRYTFLGFHLLAEVASGDDWQNTMVFPRVGCCAVYMRTAGQGNWQFSQCSLPINMINEKIYIFLWFWILSVAAATIFSIGMWMLRLFNSGIRGSFLTKYLKLADNYNELKRKAIFRKFARKYLRHDGTFVLKMIALNCGDIVCSEILQNLWSHYKSKCLQCRDEPAAAGQFIRQQSLPVQHNEEQPLHGGLRRTQCMLRLSCNNLPELHKPARRLKRHLPVKLFRRTSAPPPTLRECPTSLLPSAPPKWRSSAKLSEIDELRPADEREEEEDFNCQKEKQQLQQQSDWKPLNSKGQTGSDSDYKDV